MGRVLSYLIKDVVLIALSSRVYHLPQAVVSLVEQNVPPAVVIVLTRQTLYLRTTQPATINKTHGVHKRVKHMDLYEGERGECWLTFILSMMLLVPST